MKYSPYVALLFLFVACIGDKKSEKIDFKAQNEEEITKYIADNKLVAQRSDSGLYYIVDAVGSGAKPSASSNVTVAYKGYFLDGSVFDESDAQGISFGLQRVIKGWTEGITYFKEGGNGMLLVPAHLGYGSIDKRGIPGGSVLIFEVKLISVNN